MQNIINTIKGIEEVLINSEFGRLGICLLLLGSGMLLTLLLFGVQSAPAAISPIIMLVAVCLVLVALFAADRVLAVREGMQPELVHAIAPAPAPAPVITEPVKATEDDRVVADVEPEVITTPPGPVTTTETPAETMTMETVSRKAQAAALRKRATEVTVNDLSSLEIELPAEGN